MTPKPLNQKSIKLPFDPNGPFDVRLKPAIGHTDFWHQAACMEALDRFGKPKLLREAEAYARREEFRKEGAPDAWHRITWKFATEKNSDGYGQTLSNTMYPYSKNFSHESPVSGGVWDLIINKDELPRTLEAFAFLQQPWDIQWIFYLLSDKWTGIEKLNHLGDSVAAGVESKRLGDNWFTRPTWEFYLDPVVRYWTGQYRLKLTLSGLTKMNDEWCARVDFDCIVPERLALRQNGLMEIHHIHAYTVGDMAISLETNRLVSCFWNHFIVDGNEDLPQELGLADAAPGVRFWRRQIRLARIDAEEFNGATPEVQE